MMCEYHTLPLPRGREGHFSKAVRTEKHQPCLGTVALCTPSTDSGLSNLSKEERPHFCPLASPLKRAALQVGRKWAHLCSKYQPALSLELLITHKWEWRALLMSSLSLDFCSRNRSFKGTEGVYSMDGLRCTNYCNFYFKEIWKKYRWFLLLAL